MKRFYYPKEFFNVSNRWHIFPLLKALNKEPEGKNDFFELVEKYKAHGFLIIPMSWNYYLKHRVQKRVLDFIDVNNLKEAKTISFVFGDFGCKVPSGFNGYVYRTSGRRSKLPRNHIGIPIFVDDPIKKFYRGDLSIIKRSYCSKPIVGFCGQAHSFGIKTIKELSKTLIKNILSGIGIYSRDTDQLMSTSNFRWNILKSISKVSKLITANFIIRSSYRAGVTKHKDSHSSTMEFFDNIKDSDYVVCMRGAGNFSTRFYETLAMGRIPIFVNTDCILPHDFINWKEHVVWVEASEKHLITEKIIEFHSKLDEKSINKLFLKNRKLWEDYLRLYPFFNVSLNNLFG